MTAALPQPRGWFLMTYCDCGHPRKDHVEDGPCAYIWEFPSVGLFGCQDRCQAMRRLARSGGFQW